MNQYIQKQIDLLENADIWREVENDPSVGDSGFSSEIDFDKVKAFLQTSLESIWKDAEKEVAKKIKSLKKNPKIKNGRCMLCGDEFIFCHCDIWDEALDTAIKQTT